MRIAICGYGNLGEGVECAVCNAEDAELVGIFSRRDPKSVTTLSGAPVFPAEDLLKFKDKIDVVIICGGSATDAVKMGIPVVIATTGHTDEELAVIREAAKQIPIFHSANMSVGVALLVKLAKTAAAAMPDAEIEIIEKHHDRKVDAPSGTAMMIYRELATVRTDATANPGRSGYNKRTPNEIGIHAVRMGNIVGEHEVIIGTASQAITLKHEAYDRALFAEGAIVAAGFLKDCKPGLYDMHDLLKE